MQAQPTQHRPARNLIPPDLDVKRFYHDTAYFARRVFNVTPTDQQIAISDTVRDAKIKQIAIGSGHGIGKTAYIAWLIIQCLSTRPAFLGVIATPKEDQFKEQVWAEVRRWLKKAPPIYKENIIVVGEKIFRKDAKADAFFLGQVCRKENPEALQGYHHDHMVVITDESSGIPDVLFRPVASLLTKPDNRFIMISNPTRRSGFFYDAFHKNAADWTTMLFSSLDSPLVDPGFALKIANTYGEQSNIYRFMVLGLFPEQDTDSLILYKWCEEAMARLGDFDSNPLKYTKQVPVRIGIDPARSVDGDPSGFAARASDVVIETDEKWLDDEMDVVAYAREFRDRIVKDFKTPFDAFYVDTIGIGAGVHDRLKELEGSKAVVDVNVARKPTVKPTKSDARKKKEPLPARLRDELWWRARNSVRDNLHIPSSEDKLVAELTSPRLGYTSDGKIKVESKDDMKKRGISSPGRADALCLTFHKEGRSISPVAVARKDVYPDA